MVDLLQGWMDVKGVEIGSHLIKYHEGIISGKDENGLMTNETLVHFKFRHNIPAKEAAQLLIDRLREFQKECDEYNIS